ncbi:MAG: SpoIIE family protein phosphatase [Oscillospiraceae bacterium]|nr:SpoIIE family protein phosphatase [Oscillospiraceae bacterium]
MEEVKTRKTQVKAFRDTAKKVMLWLAAAGAGFCMSAVKIEGEISPFAAALAAGASNFYVLPCAIGGAAGALIFFEPLIALKYAGALTLICLLRAVYEKLTLKGKELLIYPLIAFFSIIVSAGIISVAGSLSASGILIILCEALLSAGSACFSYRLFTLFPGNIKGVGASAADTAAVLISCAVFLLSLDSVKFFGFSLGHFIAYLLVLTLSCCTGTAVGSAAGICAGIILGFSPEKSYITYLLPAGGLLCGIISGYGRLASSGVFAALGILFITVKSDDPLPLIAEVLAAAFIFLIVPKKLMSKIENAISPFTKEKYALDASASLYLRLKRSAKAVRDISDYVKAVSRVKDSPINKTEALSASVKNEICSSCAKKERCWGADRLNIQLNFENIAKTAAEGGISCRSELPEYIRKVCRKPNELISAFERKYCVCLARESAENEIYDIKSVAAAQFENTAAILDDAASETNSILETDPYISALAADVFKEQGFKLTSLLVSASDNMRVIMEAFCSFVPPKTDYNLLIERLKQKTGIRFSLPQTDEYKNEGTVLCFCEKTVFSTQFAKLSSAATGEKLCGDTAEGFFDGRGNFFFVLSDGMGSGRRAALDSLLTSSLFSRLMRAGFSPDTAVKAVNGALLMRNGEETLATLDVLKLDLYSGKAVFYKAGASFSALKKENKTVIVERSSMPLGIVNEVNLEKSETVLSANDTVILMSDGASFLPKDFFKELFYNHKNADARELAELTLKEAKNRSPIGRADDITVLCVKLV